MHRWARGREASGVVAPPVAQFWLLALLGPVVAALVVRSFTDSLSPVTSTIVIVAAMPAPLVAAMVVGQHRWRDIRRSVRRGFDAPLLLFVVAGAILLVWVVGAFVLTALLGNVAGVEGAGRIAMDVEDVRANIASLLDAEAASTADIPPVPVVVGGHAGDVGHGDICAQAGERIGGRRADAVVGAGNNGHTAIERTVGHGR